jgi:hypothetical protein
MAVLASQGFAGYPKDRLLDAVHRLGFDLQREVERHASAEAAILMSETK